MSEDEKSGSLSQDRPAPPTLRPNLSDGESQQIRDRQHARARIMAWMLGAFVLLMFFITMAKTGLNW